MENARENILAAAKLVAQAHGYAGLNFRDLAKRVGIKAASVYYHYPSKADLASAVARRYWEDSREYLNSLLDEAGPKRALHRYPETFRWALANDNRICLCSFMSAEFDDLPDQVKTEVQKFADVNLEWLKKALLAAKLASTKDAEKRATAIYSGIVGAQLLSRSRTNVAVYDDLIATYRATGLLPS